MQLYNIMQALTNTMRRKIGSKVKFYKTQADRLMCFTASGQEVSE